ncbi:hypothetical protein EDB81DRAFT_760464 [Dactylonectria macrodidyma]|uniref:Xylanolytic transcriptional activator regulatory domain-containing protein n=1 Tax=Dactylonectria macrodidyma TaxID=307937 RepID=A0A9P9EQY6_9HYPO|nr:hypothetical protein EDB81DRAFT_760464 [Dactylonectria macrodidyma]
MPQDSPQPSADPGQLGGSASVDVSTTETSETSGSPRATIEIIVPATSDIPAQRRARVLNSRVSLSCDLCHKRKIKTLRALGKRGRKARSRLPDKEVLDLLRPAVTEPPGLSSPGTAPNTFPAEPQHVAAGNLPHDLGLQQTRASNLHSSPQDWREASFGPNPGTSLRISCTLPCLENVKFHIWLQDLARDLAAANVRTESVISYMTTCMELFSDNIYPIYPVIYKPDVSRTLVELQDPGEAWDTKSFMLLTSICAYTLAVLPTSISGASWTASQAFYRVFKKAQNAYGLADIEYPSSSSVVIHLMHAAWHHVSGSSKASWYVLGEAIRAALLMRLHDEKTYEAMPFVESQLCRRAFWVLYTGCQASCFLGEHPSIFNKSLFWGVAVPRYPEEFGPEDRATVTHQNGRQHNISILTGFNANQDLWRAAEDLLLAERDGDSGATATSDCTSRRLTTAYVKFCTVLDDLPTVLRFHNSVDATVEGFFFADQGDHRPHVPQALATQRTNLHISYQYLKLFFLRKYPFLCLFPALSNLTPSTYSRMSLSPLEKTAVNPTSRLSSHRHDQGRPQTEHPQSQRGLGTGLVRQTLQIAEDMLYVIHTSGVDSLRLNGEPCTEKIRRVAASVLEVLAQDVVDAALLERAVKFRDLYPHLLARLESKASDEPDSAAAGSSGVEAYSND